MKIKTNNIAHVRKHVCKQTLCASDINSTLYTTEQFFGNSRWADKYHLEMRNKHQDEKLAETAAFEVFDAVQQKTRIKPMEWQTSLVMQDEISGKLLSNRDARRLLLLGRKPRPGAG